MIQQTQCPNCSSYRTVTKGRRYYRSQAIGGIVMTIISFGLGYFAPMFNVMGILFLILGLWYIYKTRTNVTAVAWCRHCNYKFAFSELN